MSIARRDISEVFHSAGDIYTGQDEPYLFGRTRAGSGAWRYRSFALFRDPDGNGWLLQEIMIPLERRRGAVGRSGTPSTLADLTVYPPASRFGVFTFQFRGSHFTVPNAPD